MDIVAAIENFYLFFQGILMFQVLFFGALFLLTRRKEILYYSLMIFVTCVYFFLNAPDTFFNIDDNIVFNATWYSYINFALLLGMMLVYLIFLREIFEETYYKPYVKQVYKSTLILIPITYIVFAICTYYEFNSNLVFYAAHVINGPFCTLIIMYNIKKKGNVRLLMIGMFVVFIGVIITMIMTIRYNQGHFGYYIEKYPLLYIRIGMLIDILLFQFYLIINWVDQEKKLALQKINAQLEIAKMKNEINRELHDNVGTSLSKINLQSYMAVQKLDDPGFNASNIFTSIQTEAQTTIQKIKEMVSSEDLLVNFSLCLKTYAYAKEMCESKGIHFKNGIDLNSDLALHLEQKYQLFLIAKEAINNAIKYSEASQIAIELKTQKDGFYMKIADNGIGYDSHKIKSGQGIINMKYRAKRIHADIQIMSKLTVGTAITVFLEKGKE